MFIFLFAGHEVNSYPPSCCVVVKSSPQTTAHTLCFTFALLALYPYEQERLYQHIKGVMSSLNGMPVGSMNSNLYRELITLKAYEDMSRFTHSLA
jgi:cytochrome P450